MCMVAKVTSSRVGLRVKYASLSCPQFITTLKQNETYFGTIHNHCQYFDF